MGGVTPLMFVAQNRQYDVLKVLLQYGMLERERRSTYIIISVLFHPPRLEMLDERSLGEETQCIRECIELCSRVLTSISISDIEVQWTTAPTHRPTPAVWEEVSWLLLAY